MNYKPKKSEYKSMLFIVFTFLQIVVAGGLILLAVLFPHSWIVPIVGRFLDYALILFVGIVGLFAILFLVYAVYVIVSGAKNGVSDDE